MSEYTAFLLHKMLVVTVNCLMLGALFLGEQIHPTTGVALALILGSVAMNQWAQQRRTQREVTLCQAS